MAGTKPGQDRLEVGSRPIAMMRRYQVLTDLFGAPVSGSNIPVKAESRREAALCR